jgi:hypothetical protein
MIALDISHVQIFEGRGNSLLSLGPSKQDLLGLDAQPLGDLVDWFIDWSTGLGGERDQARVTLWYDVVVLHVLQERLGRLDNVWVKQDLVDDRLHIGY